MDYKLQSGFDDTLALEAEEADERAEEGVMQRSLKYFDFGATLAQLSGAAMLGLAAYVFGTSNGGLQWNISDPNGTKTGSINFHGLFMSTAMVFLQGESLLIFRLYRHEMKLVAKSLQGVFHLFSICLVVGGLLSIIAHKNLYSLPHFTSHHSWIGLFLLVGYLLYLLIGAFNFWFPTTTAEFQHLLLPVHRAFGVALFLLGVGQMLTGSLRYSDIVLGGCYNTASCPKRMALLLNLGVVSALCYAVSVCILLGPRSWRRESLPQEKKVD